MPIHSVVVTDTYAELIDGDKVYHFDFADFPPSANTNQKRQDLVLQHVQDWLDNRVLLSSLPVDDPYVTGGDPGLPYRFYEGNGNNTVMVERNVVIENVVYDPAATPPLTFTLRQIWPVL